MIKDLVPDDSTHLKTLLAGHRVYNHVAMYADEVLAIEDRIFVLACRINDFYSKILVLVTDDFAKGVLDGRVVGIDEVAIDELDCQRAFAYSSIKKPALAPMPGLLLHTDGPATDNSHLPLLLLRRHGWKSMRWNVV